LVVTISIIIAVVIAALFAGRAVVPGLAVECLAEGRRAGVAGEVPRGAVATARCFRWGHRLPVAVNWQTGLVGDRGGQRGSIAVYGDLPPEPGVEGARAGGTEIIYDNLALSGVM
jgi:hypothetical protein